MSESRGHYQATIEAPKAVIVEGKQCQCGALRGKPHTLACPVAYPRERRSA